MIREKDFIIVPPVGSQEKRRGIPPDLKRKPRPLATSARLIQRVIVAIGQTAVSAEALMGLSAVRLRAVHTVIAVHPVAIVGARLTLWRRHRGGPRQQHSDSEDRCDELRKQEKPPLAQAPGDAKYRRRKAIAWSARPAYGQYRVDSRPKATRERAHPRPGVYQRPTHTRPFGSLGRSPFLFTEDG